MVTGVLLLGPTGVGKTPLGQWLEREGLWGRDCLHFDFGANLREIHALGGASGLPAADCAIVSQALQGGLLLENEHFHIAAAVLDRFLSARRADADATLVLNGLPRHVGQARDVATLVDIRDVICLEGDADTVFARIEQDAGGDRAGRTDDAREAVVRKLALYAARTEPLIAHYADMGVCIHRIRVTVHAQSEDMAAELAAMKPKREGAE